MAIISEATAQLKAELAAEPDSSRLDAERAWRAFGRFAREDFSVVPEADADGLLFEYGTYNFYGPEEFLLSFSRQFLVVDADGEYSHYIQVQCMLRYRADPDLRALGADHDWYFYDSGLELHRWIEDLKPEPVWERVQDRDPIAVIVEVERMC
jgi:hypothetical protein